MAIFPNINPATTSGTDLATLLNSFRDSVVGGFIGTSRPANLQKAGYWIDNSLEISNGLFKYYMFDGTSDVLIFTISKTTGRIIFPDIDASQTIKKVSADANGAIMKLSKARIATNGQVLSGDQLGKYTFSSTDETGAEIADPVSIDAIAAENHTASASGTYLRLRTTENGTVTPKTRVIVEHDGAVKFMGNTSGYVGIKPPAAPTSHSVILPSAQGAADTFLKNDGSGNLSWASAGGGNGWAKYTISHTALQAAALTNDTALLTLPVKGVVEAILLKTTTAFAGTGITDYDLTVGITGNESKYLPIFDADTAVSGSYYQSSSVLTGGEDFNATENIKVFATSVGANLDQSTAGSVDIYVKVATLP